MVNESWANLVRAAHVVLEVHPRVCVPEPVCSRCLKPFPCAEVRWATEIIERERAHDGPTGLR